MKLFNIYCLVAIISVDTPDSSVKENNQRGASPL